MAVTGVLPAAPAAVGALPLNGLGPGAAGPASNEDAAAIVQEFFSSLDNLPNEVQFLLEEMRLKEERINGLLKRIETRSAAIFKNARPKPGAPASDISTKDQQSLDKIPLEWAKIAEVQAEKGALAERLLTLVNRARERGRDEWRKVVGADEADALAAESAQETDLVEKVVAGSEVAVLGILQGLKAQAGAVGLVGALQRAGAVPGVPSSGTATPVDDRMSKKRKTGSTLTNMPPPPTPLGGSHLANANSAYAASAGGGSAGGGNPRKRRAHSQSASIPPSAADEDADVDAEGEEDDGNGDDALYCLCQQKSYGEMIGCDNDDCKYEWFHLKCVKLEPPLPATWYCPSCIIEMEQKAQRKRDGQRKRR